MIRLCSIRYLIIWMGDFRQAICCQVIQIQKEPYTNSQLRNIYYIIYYTMFDNKKSRTFRR